MSLKSYALTTDSRLASFLGITPNASQTTLLINIINAVTEYIEHYCKRRFKLTTYTNEVYNGDGGGALLLKNYPVSDSHPFSISVRESALNEASWSGVGGLYYDLDYEAGIVAAMGSYKFGRGRGRYRVTYTAGYDFDNATTFLSDTEAGDLEYAAWKLAASAYLSRKSQGGETQERIGDYSVTFAKTAFEDEQIKSILDKYDRVEASAGITPLAY